MMKQRMTWMLVTLAITVSCQNIPGGNKKAGLNLGNEQGNGTDNVPFGFGAAWVMHPNAIKYCTVIASDFGASAAQLNSELQIAFTTWREYIVTKK